jgi:hypothetical protein
MAWSRRRWPLAAFVLHQRDDAGVAGDTSRGFGWNRRTVLDLATTGSARAQGLGGDVYDDLLAIRAGSFQHIVRQETFGDAANGIGAALAVWHDLFGRSSGNVLVDLDTASNSQRSRDSRV